MSDLPRPWMSESLSDYARRCGLDETRMHEVREHWHTELTRVYAEWRAAGRGVGAPEEIP